MSDHGLLLVHWSHTINAGDLAPRLLRGPLCSESLDLHLCGAGFAQGCVLACGDCWLGKVTERRRGVSGKQERMEVGVRGEEKERQSGHEEEGWKHKGWRFE